jgi:hypothetical protein
MFQSDIATTMGPVDSTHCYYLNSDDLHDNDLALKKTKSLGGTLLMWKKKLNPYVSIYSVNTHAFTPLVLQLPGHKISIHISLYLPTSGKDQEFVNELSNLRLCLDELAVLYSGALVFIRGDSNVNQNNASRVVMFNQFLEHFSFSSVHIEVPTYHHFTCNGLYDSNIDVLLYPSGTIVKEHIVRVMCILTILPYYPTMI